MQQYGVTEEEYADILRKNQSHGMRVNEIEDLLREREGRPGILGRFFGKEKREARLLAQAKELGGAATKREIDKILKEVNEEMSGLGETLTTTLLGNAELNQAIGMIIRGEKPPKIEANIMGYAEAKSLLLTEAQVAERWEQEKLKPEYKKLDNDTDKRNAHDAFMKNLTAPTSRKTGFFTRFARTFLQNIVTGMQFTL